MYEIIISWEEKGLNKIKTIKQQQPTSKNPGTIRLGREPSFCDITFTDPRVSRLHVEIFYNDPHNKFYLRNLTASNPPMVDNQLVVNKYAEVALNHNSLICLGPTKIQVIYNTNNNPTILRPQIPTNNNNTSPYISQQVAPITQPPLPGPTHLVCPNYNCTNPDPRRLVPIQMNNVGYCPWCGTSLADAGSMVISHNN